MDLVVYAMERSETEEKFDDGGTSQLLWQHLSSQLIFFVLFQFASFPHMVLSLHQKVSTHPFSEPLHLLISIFQTGVSSERKFQALISLLFSALMVSSLFTFLSL